jgi:transcriptional regulatory protein LevR
MKHTHVQKHREIKSSITRYVILIFKTVHAVLYVEINTKIYRPLEHHLTKLMHNVNVMNSGNQRNEKYR